MIMANGFNYSTTSSIFMISLPQQMRAIPTSSYTGNWMINGATGNAIAMTSYTHSNLQSSDKSVSFNTTVASGLVAGNGTFFQANNDATARIIVSAEL